ncbi:MAG: aspartate carbamoyltransferase [Kiritimatiellae bacterium]|nr:aspartate carbamoyltransferase [Kiritimatiellia bacterium]MDW8457929.1 aspartate carbamoyltransferase [Verrucomicrobiota bacterium]
MAFRESPLRSLPWETFRDMDPEQKGPLLNRGSRPYHALIAQQFDRPMLDRIGDLATKMRKIAKTRGGMKFLQDLLSEKRAMLYFAQPSTRTFLSFYAACQILGIQPAEVRDAHTSSEIKGESQEDSVRTFSSYFDVIIMRHPEGGFAERIAWMLSRTDRPVPVINAGSGKDQHPTQALLDIYTLQRSLEKRRGGLEGATIAFVGDLLRGRTVRSLSLLLRHYAGVKQIFVAPRQLQIGADILEKLDAARVSYELTSDFESVLPLVDAVYMTRIQDEWDQAGESRAIDTTRYHLRVEHLRLLKPEAIIMHPLPRRNEIAPEIDNDPRAKYWRQVRNGMWVRAVLLAMIFEREQEIDRYHEDLTS